LRSRSPLVVALPLILAVHLGLAWLAFKPEPRRLWGDERTYLGAAERAVAGEPRRASEALWPPLYPAVLALVLAAGGGGAAIYLLQTALLVAAALALRSLAADLLRSRWAGDLAAALLLLYPPLVAFCGYLWPEVLHLALALGALWLLRGAVTGRLRGAGWAAAAGALLGLALLAKSLLGPFVPLLLVPLARAGGWRRGLPRAAAAALAAALVVVPTQLANRQRMGVFATAASVPFNLWVGLEDTGRREGTGDAAGPVYQEWRCSAPEVAQRNRLLLDRAAGELRRHGLPAVLREQLGKQYFRLFDADGFLTAQLPGGPVAARGTGYAGMPPRTAQAVDGLGRAAYALLIVAAAAGAALCTPRRAGGWAWLALGFVGYNLAIFLAIHVSTRYRVQMLPVALLWAAAAGDRVRLALARRRRRRPEDAPAAGRAAEVAAPPGPAGWVWGLAAGCGGVVLYLAFGA
jgi:hypothetical protein